MADEVTYRLFGEEVTDKWEHDVWLMARRMAIMYHYFAQQIVERLGDEEGRELIKGAIWKYGLHCGAAVKDGVEALGLPLTAENYSRVPDLPSRGWRRTMAQLSDGTKQVQVKCPLAKAWRELGGDPSLYRLYCWVDQAKIEAYNGEELFCVHRHNVLDGDDFCEIVNLSREP